MMANSSADNMYRRHVDAFLIKELFITLNALRNCCQIIAYLSSFHILGLVTRKPSSECSVDVGLFTCSDILRKIRLLCRNHIKKPVYYK